jgi:acyl-CoA thioester hydrolase
MPRIHTETFSIRSYECDAYGHLNNAMYLRLMQEAAFSASAAAGYDDRKYRVMRRVWLIRETEIDYLKPLMYLDRVEIKTWVEDIRRVRSRRRYEFRLAGADQLAARGSTDWIFLDRETLKPATIPIELIAAFFPDDEPPASMRREPFPEPPPAPPGVFNFRKKVEWRDIDGMQHLNNAAYLSYAEEAAVELSEAYGWPLTRGIELGMAFVAQRTRIQYIQPAFLGDEVEVRTWLIEIRPASALRHYDILAGDSLLARIQTRWVFFDLASRRPRRFPDEFRELLANNTAS